MKIGFIGLGIMGKPMAKNLIKAGYELTVFDVVSESVEELKQCGAKSASSPMDVAKDNTIIITMLPNSPHVEEVILGENGIIKSAQEGTIVVDMSSINPLVSKDIYSKLAGKNIEMLDAPVSGGEPKSIDATLAIMVGGKQEVFDKVKDILAKMGSSVILTGDIGSGNVTKLANQIIVAGNIAAMSEAFALATKAGVDAENVYKAIRGGLAGSNVLDAKAPMILEGNFNPGFRVELHIKDLNNVLDTAKSLGVETIITNDCMMIFEELKKIGKEKQDHCSMIEYYENKAGIKVRRKK